MLKLEQNQKHMETSFNKSKETIYSKIQESNDGIKKQTEELEKCRKQIEELVAENKQLKEKVCVLKSCLDEQEQYSRRNTVEICAIMQEKMKMKTSVMKEAGKALDMDISKSKIDACHRLGGRPGLINSPLGYCKVCQLPR